MNTKQETIELYIKQLQKKQIGFSDIPENLWLNSDIIKTERKLKIRQANSRGYDVITNTFFVDEIIKEKVPDDDYEESFKTTFFDTFEDFYTFLNGDIYNNSCYYQYTFSNEQIKKYNLKLKKLSNNSLINETIDDYSIDNILSDEKREYHLQEKNLKKEKEYILKCFDQIKKCNSSDELKKIFCEFIDWKKHSSLRFINPEDLITNFIASKPEKAFDVLMDLVNSGQNIFSADILCFYYDPQKVLTTYNYRPRNASKSTISKRRTWLKKFVSNIIENGYTTQTKYGFDSNTHFFYERTEYWFNNNPYPLRHYNKYFNTFEEFIDYLDGDLSDCDLSAAILLNVDFSNYKTNNNTKLPINKKHLKYQIEKTYVTDLTENYFTVVQKWNDINGNIVKSVPHTFSYFFDFVHFLKGDLSGSDLILCDGFINLPNISNLNLSDAKIQSRILDKFGLSYQCH